MSSAEQARWFAEHVQPYEPALRAFLSKRFPAVADHEDLLQETYIRLLRANERGTLTDARGFLFKVARNAAIDMFRRERSSRCESLSELEATPSLEAQNDLRDALDQRQRLDILVDAIEALPERCREVMMLRHIEGLSYKEIAARLRISADTVKAHIVKGMRDCTIYFARRGALDQHGELQGTSNNIRGVAHQ
jgi:RNA polymerase sigma factor (sigma-70 family)